MFSSRFASPDRYDDPKFIWAKKKQLEHQFFVMRDQIKRSSYFPYDYCKLHNDLELFEEAL